MLTPRDEEKLSERFGDLIYQLRESKKLSQRAAAKLIGISQARLVSLEQGVHAATGKYTYAPAELVGRIAATYGYPKAELMLIAGYNPWLVDEGEAKRVVELLGKSM